LFEGGKSGGDQGEEGEKAQKHFEERRHCLGDCFCLRVGMADVYAADPKSGGERDTQPPWRLAE
jgi:hypothetical protein